MTAESTISTDTASDAEVSMRRRISGARQAEARATLARAYCMATMHRLEGQPCLCGGKCSAPDIYRREAESGIMALVAGGFME